MEQQNQTIVPAVVSDDKRDLFIREAGRLIGQTAAIRAKANADVAKQKAQPGFVEYGQHARVWGMNLRGDYANTRRQAHSLKQLFVTELGIQDDLYKLDYAFQECTQEDFGSNLTKLDEGIRTLELLIGLAYYNPNAK